MEINIIYNSILPEWTVTISTNYTLERDVRELQLSQWGK